MSAVIPPPQGVIRAKAKVALRVRLVAFLLRVLGRKREAQKLQIGFRQCEASDLQCGVRCGVLGLQCEWDDPC